MISAWKPNLYEPGCILGASSCMSDSSKGLYRDHNWDYYNSPAFPTKHEKVLDVKLPKYPKRLRAPSLSACPSCCSVSHKAAQLVLAVASAIA